MAKFKTKRCTSTLPLAPWIYLNDPSKGALAFFDYLPTYQIVDTNYSPLQLETDKSFDGKIGVIVDDKQISEEELKGDTAKQYREACIKRGCNFVSIDVSSVWKASQGTEAWGTNHLDIFPEAGSGVDGVDLDIGGRIYKWLFQVLTVPESLYLIPEGHMRAIDTKSFPDYEYCSIADAHKQPKDAKIQFVTLITSKPQVGANKRISWTVADHTGIANFYFQWRGAESKYTWDWVLKLEPGDRRALPRMPMIKIKEKKRVRVLKAPVRGVAALAGGTGLAFRGIGRCLCAVGKAAKMGNSSEWVPEADVKDGKKIKHTSGPTKVASPKKELKIFNEKGQRVWKDDDSVASTRAASIFDEKATQEFC